MPLTQVQIIQSLGKRLADFEEEIGWGTPEQELRHLTGRIGELYAAMITRGQMATEVNQRGYDVVSAEGERISVKTITSTTSIRFKETTFEHVDRVMILRINVDEDAGISIETLFDEHAATARDTLGDQLVFYPTTGNKRRPSDPPVEEMLVTANATFEKFTIRHYENATVLVFEGIVRVSEAKPVLRAIAAKIGVDLLNRNGQAKNTRQLGADVIRTLNALGR